MPTAYWASSILLLWKIFLKDQIEPAFHPSLVLPPSADGSHLDNFPTNTSSISYEENWFQKIVEGESDNEINENKFKRKKLLLPSLQLFLFLLPFLPQFRRCEKNFFPISSEIDGGFYETKRGDAICCVILLFRRRSSAPPFFLPQVFLQLNPRLIKTRLDISLCRHCRSSHRCFLSQLVFISKKSFLPFTNGLA